MNPDERDDGVFWPPPGVSPAPAAQAASIATVDPLPPPTPSKKRRTGRTLTGVALIAVLSGGTGAAVATWADPDPAERTGIVQSGGPAGGSAPTGATTEAAAARILPSVVQVQAGRATGSGVVIDDLGHVVTNAHVVEGRGDVSLVLSDGRRIAAEVLGTDTTQDIAVLRGDPDALPPAELGRSAELQVGQSVIAVGSPLGLSGTVTAGIVSALNRNAQVQGADRRFVQTDASINPGNSGGPLVDLAGRVVGINTSIATLGGQGTGNIGLGFAIPIDRALSVARTLING